MAGVNTAGGASAAGVDEDEALGASLTLSDAGVGSHAWLSLTPHQPLFVFTLLLVKKGKYLSA